jgi:hypothetical protein
MKALTRLSIVAFLACVAQAVPSVAQTNEQIRQQMIAESIRGYSGSCPCPYNSDRAGRRCGNRSAYSRPGGASPLCYPSDITDRQVQQYRQRRGL